MVKQPPQKEALVYCEGKDIWDCKLYQVRLIHVQSSSSSVPIACRAWRPDGV